MKKKLTHLTNRQAGQTLVETLVASMVLVMGISAAVALAIYGLGATTSVTKQLIAVGLARQGIEGVKNMRDTNWLREAISGSCFDFYSQGAGAYCYPTWLNGDNGGYNINPGLGDTSGYQLGFDKDSKDEHAFWSMVPENSRRELFGLNYEKSGSQHGFYYPSGDTMSSSNSGFARKISITSDADLQVFEREDLGTRLKVRVDVWWTDKRCPASDSVPASSACRITLETYLTNWKDY